MCEWTHVYQHYRDLGAYGNIGLKVEGIGYCMDCGSPLSVEEMWPSGSCTRSLCVPCYSARFNRANYSCVVCGSDISNKVAAQNMNWREIENHICDDSRCRAKWAYRHASVTATSKDEAYAVIDSRARMHQSANRIHKARRNQIPQHAASSYSEGYDDPDVIEAEFSDYGGYGLPAPDLPDIPGLELEAGPHALGLPAPQRQERVVFDDEMRSDLEEVLREKILVERRKKLKW